LVVVADTSGLLAALDSALDLTDAVNVALASDFDTDAILTLDRRDFRAVRPLATSRSASRRTTFRSERRHAVTGPRVDR
jgi:hypothetical protein